MTQLLAESVTSSMAQSWLGSCLSVEEISRCYVTRKVYYWQQNLAQVEHLQKQFDTTHALETNTPGLHCNNIIKPLKLNDPYSGLTAPLTSKRCTLYICSINIGTEHFKHGIYSQFFPLFKMQFVS